MKLTKKTRKRLYEAEGKPIQIAWPEDAPLPSWGHRYPVYSEKGDYAFTVRLEGSHRGPYETKATVRIDNDPSRVLPGLNGVRTAAGDYETEPEQVDREYEDRLAMVGRSKTIMLGVVQREVTKAESSGEGKRAEEHVARAERRREKVCSFAI